MVRYSNGEILWEVIRFATIRINSPDLEKSSQWYQSLFEISPIKKTEHFVSFRMGETYLDICPADSKSPLSQGGSVGYWLVNDLNQIVQKAIHLGGSLYRGPLEIENGYRTIAQIKDPFGNVIGFEPTL